MKRRVSYEQQLRDKVRENGNVLITIDVDARHIEAGGICVQLQLAPEQSKAVYAYAIELATRQGHR